MCTASQAWKLFFVCTFSLVALLGLWFYIDPDLSGLGVYLIKNVQEFPRCKGNVSSDAYGDPGCPDNPQREDLCALFEAWTSACKENGINYTLAFGSLLGAMRNKDIIPWDHDIDINIHVKYFPVLERWSKEKKFTKADETIRLAIQPGPVLNIPEDNRTRHNCQGEVTSSMSDMCSFLEPMARLIRGSVFVDMFHFYEKGGMIEDPSEGRVKQYPISDFYPFRPCTLMGFNTSCPNRPWKVLKSYFKTDNFKPPRMCKNGSWTES